MSGFIKEKDKQPLADFKVKIGREFPEADFILFGSKARGEGVEFSDMDILVLLGRPVTTNLEKKIFDIGFEIGLSYGLVFGIVVEEKAFYNSSLAKAMPFYQNVFRDGLKL